MKSNTSMLTFIPSSLLMTISVLACWSLLSTDAAKPPGRHFQGTPKNSQKYRWRQLQQQQLKLEGIFDILNGDYNISDLYEPQKPNGDSQCVCLTASDLVPNYSYLNYSSSNAAPVVQYGLTNENITQDNYGIGCSNHDANTTACANPDECTNTIPLPYNCDQSWCQRSWCYVDSTDCELEHQATGQWLGVSYSYATCGHMDTVTHFDHMKSLQNSSIRVALNHNTGGWMGAYHPSGRSFVQENSWYGPVVTFMTDAARSGGYNIQVTRPPMWLKAESEKFFGSSSFDYCVYATALGYLDACIGEYTITPQRAAVTPFFELHSKPIYLVVFTTTENENSWSYFAKQFWTIFQPFTNETWALIMFGVLPLLGLIMWYHEFSAPGSAFPMEYQVQVKDKETGRVVGNETRTVSPWYRLAKTLYMSFLGLCGGGYDVVVVSVGGKIHLLAILSFLLLSLAVYTANLAAILTTSLERNAVDSLDEALHAKYKFCASRQVSDIVTEIHDLDPDMWMVRDPTSIGGDGQPGFDCPRCNARTRTFDQMKHSHKDAGVHCDAAFVVAEDLEVLQQYGLHCNKTVVGEILGHTTSGIPMNSRVAPQLAAWLYDRKYQGILGEAYKEAVPASRCPATGEEQNAGVGMTIMQLAGIWGIVGALIISGLLAKAINTHYEAKYHTSAHTVVQKLILYDQWGNPVENPNIEEDTDESKEENSLVTMDHIAFVRPQEKAVDDGEVSPSDARSLGRGTSPY